MSKKDGRHFGRTTQTEILKAEGVCADNAKIIASITTVMTFVQLDQLAIAINKIKRGE